MLYQIRNAKLTVGGNIILEHFDFTIKGSEKAALVGANGAGKTVFLRMIAGQLPLKKDEKSYDTLCLRVIDDTTDDVLDCYCNFPKADKDGFVKNIGKDFDFYRNAFDFIYSVLKTRGDKYVLDKNGDEYDKFKRVDWMGFAKLVDQMSKVKVEITEGNEDSTYNSWMIISME